MRQCDAVCCRSQRNPLVNRPLAIHFHVRGCLLNGFARAFLRGKIREVRLAASILVGVIVGFAWIAILSFAFSCFGIRLWSRQFQSERRERLKRLGKLKYILVFGVCGYGISFGLMIGSARLIAGDVSDWRRQSAELIVTSLLVGFFQGYRNWNESIRDPVPFPPKYRPQDFEIRL